jgi:DNA-binding MarR family transcriptional regulator
MEISSRKGHPFSALDDHLGYWLRRVSNAVSAEFARGLQARQSSVAEWVVLRRLYDRRQTTPGQLADELNMTRGAISKITDKLQAKHWLTSRTDSGDHRVQILTLTAAGKRIVPALAQIADRNDQRFFAALSIAEQEALRHLLKKIAEAQSVTSVPIE